MKELVKRWWLRALIAAVVVLVAIQFVPYGVDNPDVHDEPAWDSARTRQLFMTSCGDCHSNETKPLWFEHVAPIKWYIADHVDEGRDALNISEWHTSAGENLDDLTEVVRDDEMPPGYYHYFGLHSDAKLTAAQRRELIDGLEATAAADPPVSRGERGGGDDDH